ncbi:fumarylacetoacetate hydrolase family protein [Streptomyces sp. NPDC057582]|uniref:fumarylacetoacetate hydrolase family protein n=1 Tax=Streptomyces sp. NPDC057582 TaxID=3346174 RepID=UPI00368E01A1
MIRSLAYLGLATPATEDWKTFGPEVLGLQLVEPGRDDAVRLKTEHVTAAEAWSHVAGVSVFNDLTARDWQRHSPQWTPGKNFPGTGAFGPALVTPDELPDFGTLTLTTRVNGQVRQHAALTDLVFDIPHLIAYISTFTPLTPGDILVTGTPGGVGQFMNPPAFLHPGDVVEIDMPGVGTLRNTVQAH